MGIRIITMQLGMEYGLTHELLLLLDLEMLGYGI